MIAAAKANVFTNNNHGGISLYRSCPVLSQPETDAGLYWDSQCLNSFEQLVSRAWPKEQLSQDIKTWPYRNSLGTACFIPSLPHGCTDTCSHACTKYTHIKKKRTNHHDKILYSQEPYSGVFTRSMVWSQVTKGKNLRPEGKHQRKELSQILLERSIFSCIWTLHIKGQCTWAPSASGGLQQKLRVSCMFVLDTPCAQFQQRSKSQTYLKGRDGAGRLKLRRFGVFFISGKVF